MGAYIHVHGYAVMVKLNLMHYFSKTQNKNSQMSQNKPSSETLKYSSIPRQF